MQLIKVVEFSVLLDKLSKYNRLVTNGTSSKICGPRQEPYVCVDHVFWIVENGPPKRLAQAYGNAIAVHLPFRQLAPTSLKSISPLYKERHSHPMIWKIELRLAD